MAQYELVCCEMCGRDTKNKSRICSICMSGVRKHTESAYAFERRKQHELDQLSQRERDFLRSLREQTEGD
jgi:predicted amidophosphoribosyltransferase